MGFYSTDKCCGSCRHLITSEAANLYFRDISPDSEKVVFVKKGTNEVMGLTDIGKLTYSSLRLKRPAYFCMHKSIIVTDVTGFPPGQDGCEFYSRGETRPVYIDTSDDSIFKQLKTGRYKCDICDTEFKLGIEKMQPIKVMGLVYDDTIFCPVCGNKSSPI